MKIITISCKSCGGPLEVANNVQQLTCTFCGAHLKISHSNNTFWSELNTKIDAQTDQLETMRLNQELEKLDQEWKEVEQKFGDTELNRPPNSYETAKIFAVGWLVITVVLVPVLWFMNQGGWILPVIGGNLLTLFMLGDSRSRLSEYQTAHTTYQKKRKPIADQLDQLKSKMNEHTS